MPRCENMELVIFIPKYVKIQEQISTGRTLRVSVMMAYRGIEIKLHLFEPSHQLEVNGQLYASTALALTKERAPPPGALSVGDRAGCRCFGHRGESLLSKLGIERCLVSCSALRLDQVAPATEQRSQESKAIVF